MMSLTIGMFTQVSGSGPLGPLVLNSRKIFPTKEMHSIALKIHVLHVKNWPQRSKRFNQPLKSKI